MRSDGLITAPGLVLCWPCCCARGWHVSQGRNRNTTLTKHVKDKTTVKETIWTPHMGMTFILWFRGLVHPVRFPNTYHIQGDMTERSPFHGSSLLRFFLWLTFDLHWNLLHLKWSKRNMSNDLLTSDLCSWKGLTVLLSFICCVCVRTVFLVA